MPVLKANQPQNQSNEAKYRQQLLDGATPHFTPGKGTNGLEANSCRCKEADGGCGSGRRQCSEGNIGVNQGCVKVYKNKGYIIANSYSIAQVSRIGKGGGDVTLVADEALDDGEVPPVRGDVERRAARIALRIIDATRI